MSANLVRDLWQRSAYPIVPGCQNNYPGTEVTTGTSNNWGNWAGVFESVGGTLILIGITQRDYFSEYVSTPTYELQIGFGSYGAETAQIAVPVHTSIRGPSSGIFGGSVYVPVLLAIPQNTRVAVRMRSYLPYTVVFRVTCVVAP